MDIFSELKIKYLKDFIRNPHGATKYLWQYPKLYPRWKNFLINFKNEKILDFGSGSGIALSIGKELGLNIIGLDIDKESVYRDMNDLFGVRPIYYDGVNIPLFDEKFDVVILHWSFLFDYHVKYDRFAIMEGEDVKIRAEQLRKLTKDYGCWWISPETHYEEAKKYVNDIQLNCFITR